MSEQETVERLDPGVAEYLGMGPFRPSCSAEGCGRWPERPGPHHVVFCPGHRPGVQVYTASRELDVQWLRAGDQIQVLPAAPDADEAWTAVWTALGDPDDAGARWMTVTAILRSDASDAAAVQLEDGSVLALVAGLDQVCVRIPADEVTL